MTHSFDVDIAKKFGVNAAILLQNIYFYCKKNKADNTNFRDGLYWICSSRRAFSVLFPYLSERQVKTALDKLVDNGLIAIGNYNDDGRDITLWYAVTDMGNRICGERQDKAVV